MGATHPARSAAARLRRASAWACGDGVFGALASNISLKYERFAKLHTARLVRLPHRKSFTPRLRSTSFHPLFHFALNPERRQLVALAAEHLEAIAVEGETLAWLGDGLGFVDH